MIDHERFRAEVSRYSMAAASVDPGSTGISAGSPGAAETNVSVEEFEAHLLACEDCCTELEREVAIRRALSGPSSAFEGYVTPATFGPVPRSMLPRIAGIRGLLPRMTPTRNMVFLRLWAAGATLAAIALIVLAVSDRRASPAPADAQVLPHVSPYELRGEQTPAVLLLHSSATEALVIVQLPDGFPSPARLTIDILAPDGLNIAHTQIRSSDLRGRSTFLRVAPATGFRPGLHLLRLQAGDGPRSGETYEWPFVVVRD